jgi:hypothetical protein
VLQNTFSLIKFGLHGGIGQATEASTSFKRLPSSSSEHARLVWRRIRTDNFLHRQEYLTRHGARQRAILANFADRRPELRESDISYLCSSGSLREFSLYRSRHTCATVPSLDPGQEIKMAKAPTHPAPRTMHGNDNRGLAAGAVPGVAFGRYGQMFEDLPAANRLPPRALWALAKAMIKVDAGEAIDGEDAADENPTIPAGICCEAKCLDFHQARPSHANLGSSR